MRLRHKHPIVLLLGLALVGSVPAYASVQEGGKPTVMRSRPLVREVQAALKDRGYDPGQVDGIMGPLTRDALRKFQEANGLAVDGQLSDETLDKLGVQPPVNTDDDQRDRGLVGDAASAVASGAETAKDATVTGAKAAAGATVTGGKAVAKGATEGGKAVAGGATTAGKKVASVAGDGADLAQTGGKKTVSAAKGAASAVGRAASGTKSFLFGNDLKGEVLDAFKKDRRIDPSHVDVDVDDRTVTLTFTGGDSAEWNRAVVVAKRVKGVERVFVRTPR